ncbi:MAG: DUF2794 domain-containing protein [Limibacillus sp.]|jgi:hypothetical protein
MATVYHLSLAPGAAPPKAARTTFFSRPELNRLLSLYSTRVATGEWRDYALDHRQGHAVFSIFRHTMESPRFTITKQVSQGGKKQEFTVAMGAKPLCRASTLEEALRVFEKKLEVVN